MNSRVIDSAGTKSFSAEDASILLQRSSDVRRYRTTVVDLLTLTREREMRELNERTSIEPLIIHLGVVVFVV